MDFKKQYELLMRSELITLGCSKKFTAEQLNKIRKDNTCNLNDCDYELSLLQNLFYSIIDRIFIQKPRKVIKYQGFNEKGNSIGIRNLENKIISGKSLIPHMSKDIFDIDQSKNNDPMLSEWKIYHFHIPPNDGNKLFVNRSKDLLFAIVEAEYVIFLDIKPHSDKTGTYKPWTDIEIIEKIEKFYPELLRQYYIGEGRQQLTTEQRKNIRASNGGTTIITAAGNEYHTAGFGSFSGGLPISSVIKGSMANRFIEKLSNTEDSSLATLSFDENYQLVCVKKTLDSRP